jgi:DNA-binding response OmpR family regulator
MAPKHQVGGCSALALSLRPSGSNMRLSGTDLSGRSPPSPKGPGGGMPVNVLVVQDEPRIAAFIKRGLEAEGFVVRTACDGAEGLNLMRSLEFDIIVLDLVLPTMSGEDVLAKLREGGSHVPVIVLTAKDAVTDRVANLEAGADDYLTKPFSFSELLARMRARLRGADQSVAAEISQGDVTLDLNARHVRLDGKDVDLTSREFALLETLMRHPGQVLSQPQLLDQVWGYDHEPSSNVVEVYVGYLRRKLRPDVVETVRGAGYRFLG